MLSDKEIRYLNAMMAWARMRVPRDFGEVKDIEEVPFGVLVRYTELVLEDVKEVPLASDGLIKRGEDILRGWAYSIMGVVGYSEAIRVLGLESIFDEYWSPNQPKEPVPMRYVLVLRKHLMAAMAEFGEVDLDREEESFTGAEKLISMAEGLESLLDGQDETQIQDEVEV